MSSSNKASTLAEQVAVKQSSEDEYVSVFYPDKMGNAANIAYGGCTIATGVSAAYQTVGPQYHAYSINGNYLGPATDDRQIFAKVTPFRDTRTFATRLVEISQEQDDGTRRKCAVMIADFQIQEPGSLLTYTTPPLRKYTSVESCPTRDEMNATMLKEGKITKSQALIQSTVFGLIVRFLEGRAVPESIFSQNLYGIAKDLPTTQDHIPFVQKTSADWVRAKAPLNTEGDHVAGLMWWMDGAISFIPLSHNHMFLEDAGACSSLDFSLRIFSNKVDLSKWHFKEMTTVHGGEGRTYSEARAWDLEGNMVACMTQQSILRPKPKPKAAL
jgi:acyl-CoA thioesterase II